MIKKLRVLLLVATLFTPRQVALAQVDLRIEIDSIEVAAIRFAKSQLGPAARTIVLDSRVRSGNGWVSTRSAANTANLARTLGAKVVDFGCDNSKPTCRAPAADVGIVLHAPEVKGDHVQITVEMHLPTGLSADTYELARQGKGWRVKRIASRSAT